MYLERSSFRCSSLKDYISFDSRNKVTVIPLTVRLQGNIMLRSRQQVLSWQQLWRKPLDSNFLMKRQQVWNPWQQHLRGFILSSKDYSFDSELGGWRYCLQRKRLNWGFTSQTCDRLDVQETGVLPYPQIATDLQDYDRSSRDKKTKLGNSRVWQITIY